MMLKRITARSLISGAAGLALVAMLGIPATEAASVNVKSGKFDTAEQKKASKAFRMKGGYKGDAEAKKLGNKLFRAARASENVALKADKSNKMMHVSKNDPAGHFRIDKTTGDFSFHNGFKNYSNDRATIGLPGKDKAANVAKKHLADLGLMPDKAEEMVVRHIGGLKQVDISKDGKVIEREKLRTVHFGRQIDGIDVGGPGSKIVVQIGANGELVSINRRWVEVTEEKKHGSDFKLQFDVVKSIKAKMQEDGAKAKQIDAGAPEFGYFDDGMGNIEPAYFYNAELTYDTTDEKGDRKQHKEKYHGVVPALKSSKANFKQMKKAGKPPGKSAPVAKDRPNAKDKVKD
jgi:hypothetical protein